MTLRSDRRQTAWAVSGDRSAYRAVDDEVQQALDDVMRSVHPQIQAALEPFGLSAFDILVPVYHQVIYEDEAPIYAQAMRNRLSERSNA